MKRAFVILLAVFMMAGVIELSFAAESDLSPFDGLRFNEPDASIVSDITIIRSTMYSPGYNSITWGLTGSNFPFDMTNNLINLQAYSNQSYEYNDIDIHYDAFTEGEGMVTEKGPKETLAGLPAFYVIMKTNTDGDISERTDWHIFGEGVMFTIIFECKTYENYIVQPPQSFNEDCKLIFENFLNSLNYTGDIGNDDNSGNNGDNNSGNNGDSNDEKSWGCSAWSFGYMTLLVVGMTIFMNKRQ